VFGNKADEISSAKLSNIGKIRIWKPRIEKIASGMPAMNNEGLELHFE